MKEDMIEVFDVDLPEEEQNPELVRRYHEGPQVGDSVWTGCTAAIINGIRDQIVHLHGTDFTVEVSSLVPEHRPKWDVSTWKIKR